MFSTICLLFFIGFILWMNTSKRVKWPHKDRVLAHCAAYPLASKYTALGFFLLACLACVHLLGSGSGLFAAVVILMMVGSLCVLLFPFRYLGLRSILTLYGLCVLSEILIY